MHAETARSRVIAAVLLRALLVGGTAHARAPDRGGIGGDVDEVDPEIRDLPNAVEMPSDRVRAGLEQ